MWHPDVEGGAEIRALCARAILYAGPLHPCKITNYIVFRLSAGNSFLESLPSLDSLAPRTPLPLHRVHVTHTRYAVPWGFSMRM